MAIQKTQKLSNADYVSANIKFSRNSMGWWQASFVCADGYQYSVCDSGTGRAVKANLKAYIAKKVLMQKDHPIQKS